MAVVKFDKDEQGPKKAVRKSTECHKKSKFLYKKILLKSSHEK